MVRIGYSEDARIRARYYVLGITVVQCVNRDVRGDNIALYFVNDCKMSVCDCNGHGYRAFMKKIYTPIL